MHSDSPDPCDAVPPAHLWAAELAPGLRRFLERLFGSFCGSDRFLGPGDLASIFEPLHEAQLAALVARLPFLAAQPLQISESDWSLAWRFFVNLDPKEALLTLKYLGWSRPGAGSIATAHSASVIDYLALRAAGPNFVKVMWVGPADAAAALVSSLRERGARLTDSHFLILLEGRAFFIRRPDCPSAHPDFANYDLIWSALGTGEARAQIKGKDRSLPLIHLGANAGDPPPFPGLERLAQVSCELLRQPLAALPADLVAEYFARRARSRVCIGLVAVTAAAGVCLCLKALKSGLKAPG